MKYSSETKEPEVGFIDTTLNTDCLKMLTVYICNLSLIPVQQTYKYTNSFTLKLLTGKAHLNYIFRYKASWELMLQASARSKRALTAH